MFSGRRDLESYTRGLVAGPRAGPTRSAGSQAGVWVRFRTAGTAPFPLGGGLPGMILVIWPAWPAA